MLFSERGKQFKTKFSWWGLEQCSKFYILCCCQLIWMTQKSVKLSPIWNWSRSKCCENVSKNMTFTFMPYFTLDHSIFHAHNTRAGFVLLLLDFLHIQYILSEQTDMSCLFNNYKSRQFVFWNVCFFLIAKFRSHDSANIVKCFSCMLFVILRAPLSQRAPLRIHMIFHHCSKEFWEFMKFYHLHFFEKQSW